MRNRSLGLIAVLAVLTIVSMAVVPGAFAQAEYSDQPLGDAAREQREIRRENPVQPKVYVETGTASAQSPSTQSASEAHVAAAHEQEPKTSPPSSHEKPGSSARTPYPVEPEGTRSLLDRPSEDHDSDFLVVPAGTQVSVEFAANLEFPALAYVGKVAAPVRVGFATAIPALSHAEAQVLARRYPAQGSAWGSAYAYFEAVELSNVTVDGVAYAVRTDRVAKFGTNTSASEATFTLTEPLKIHR